MVSKFSVVSLQYHQLLDQLRPVLKHNVVFPKVGSGAWLPTAGMHGGQARGAASWPWRLRVPLCRAGPCSPRPAAVGACSVHSLWGHVLMLEAVRRQSTSKMQPACR